MLYISVILKIRNKSNSPIIFVNTGDVKCGNKADFSAFDHGFLTHF